MARPYPVYLQFSQYGSTIFQRSINGLYYPQPQQIVGGQPGRFQVSTEIENRYSFKMSVFKWNIHIPPGGQMFMSINNFKALT